MQTRMDANTALSERKLRTTTYTDTHAHTPQLVLVQVWPDPLTCYAYLVLAFPQPTSIVLRLEWQNRLCTREKSNSNKFYGSKVRMHGIM